MATWIRYAPRPGTLVSTVMLVLAVPPVQWTFLIWVGLIPWFFSIRRSKSTFQAALQGFWLNLLSGFGGTFWIAHAAERYLSVGLPAGLLVLLAHAVVHQLQFVLFAGFYWRVLRGAAPSRVLELLLLAMLYTGLDWLTPKLFQDSLGVVLYSNVPLRQLAAIGGAPLLTFVVLTVNLGLYALANEALAGGSAPRPLLRRATRRAGWLVASLLPLVALAASEEARMTRALDAAGAEIRVGIVQGNVREELKRRWARGDPEAAAQSLSVYVRGTEELLAGSEPPELVVWPETAYPGVFRKPENDAQLRLNVGFDRYIAESGIPIAFGAYDREDRTDRRVLRNAVFLVAPASNQPVDRLSPMQVYHKNILFPFGEYVPLLDEATARQWLPGSARLSRGEALEVLELPLRSGDALRLGPAICYEDLFTQHTRALADLGADVLLNVSNDSWFGDYGAARWHLMMAALRSIETRLPQVRATNSGYSALVLPNGDLNGVTEFGERAVRVLDVPMMRHPPTLRARLGDWFGPLCVLLCASWLIARSRWRAGAKE